MPPPLSARSLCILLRHPRRIVLQECNLIQAEIEERIIQLASGGLRVGGLRLINAIQTEVSSRCGPSCVVISKRIEKILYFQL